MHRHTRGAIAIFILFALVAPAWAEPQPVRQKPVDAATLAAYKKLGFICDTPGIDSDRRFSHAKATRGIGEPDATLPVFYLVKPPDGKLPALAEVAVPFGLGLNGLGVVRVVDE